MMQRQTNAYLWLLLPVILFMTLMGGRGLNMDALFHNGESLSVAHAGGMNGPFSPQQIIEAIRTVSPQHGPLYFLLLGAWGNVLGWQPFSLRLLSLFCGLLTIAITYRLGRDLFSPLAGFCAAAVIGVSFYLIDYTHTIRMYTMVPMQLAFILWLYQRLVQPRHAARTWEWVALFGLTAAAMYTHYLSLLVLGAIGFYHLFFASKNRRWLEISVVMTLAVLTFLPWVPVMVSGEEERKDLSETALSPLGTIELLGYLFGNGLTVLTGGATLLAGYALFRRQRNALMLWVIVLVAVAGVVAFNVLSPLVPADRSRYFLIFWPLLALLVGLGLAQLRRWPLVIAALLVTWTVIGFVIDQNPYFMELKSAGGKPLADYPNYPLINAELQAYAQPNDLMITFSAHAVPTRKVGAGVYPSINDYYFHLLGGDALVYLIDTGRSEEGIEDTDGEVLQAHDRVWLIHEPFRVPRMLDNFRRVLLREFEACEPVVDRPELRIEQFVKDSHACSS